MGVAIGILSKDDGAGGTTSGHTLGWGKAFSFGEIGVTMYGKTVETAATAGTDEVAPSGDYVAPSVDGCTGGTSTGAEANETACDAVSGTWTDAYVEDPMNCGDGDDACQSAPIGSAGSGHAGSGAVAGADAASTDNSGMAINFTKACDFWVFDTMVASYTSDTVGDADASTVMSVDWVSHMNAGAADVVWAMGVDMNDTGVDKGDATVLANALGVEANMTDWATLRAGVEHSYTLSSGDDTSGASDWGWNFGLGFNWGDFTADYTIDDGIFQDPISTITGYDDAALTTQSVTFTYNF